MMFPGLLMTLLDKCGISPDKRVTAHPFFGLSAQTRFEDTLHLSQREGERVCVCAHMYVCVCVWGGVLSFLFCAITTPKNPSTGTLTNCL